MGTHQYSVCIIYPFKKEYYIMSAPSCLELSCSFQEQILFSWKKTWKNIATVSLHIRRVNCETQHAILRMEHIYLKGKMQQKLREPQMPEVCVLWRKGEPLNRCQHKSVHNKCLKRLKNLHWCNFLEQLKRCFQLPPSLEIEETWFYHKSCYIKLHLTLGII